MAIWCILPPTFSSAWVKEKKIIGYFFFFLINVCYLLSGYDVAWSVFCVSVNDLRLRSKRLSKVQEFKNDILGSGASRMPTWHVSKTNAWYPSKANCNKVQMYLFRSSYCKNLLITRSQRRTRFGEFFTWLCYFLSQIIFPVFLGEVQGPYDTND